CHHLFEAFPREIELLVANRRHALLEFGATRTARGVIFLQARQVGGRRPLSLRCCAWRGTAWSRRARPSAPHPEPRCQPQPRLFQRQVAGSRARSAPRFHLMHSLPPRISSPASTLPAKMSARYCSTFGNKRRAFADSCPARTQNMSTARFDPPGTGNE